MDGRKIDYHVHLADEFTVDAAAALAAERGEKFGILEHPGFDKKIHTDADLEQYISELRTQPVYVGLQPVYLKWKEQFSSDLVAKLDYVLMDADTVPLPEGGFLLIWRHDLFISDLKAFMEIYMRHIMQILENEPIDIFARPTYLPINFARHYDEIWTEERMRAIIDVAVERKIALEIQENVRIPSYEFIRLAKRAGAIFSFGTNARNNNAGDFHYCVQAAEDCGLTEKDFFTI